MNVYASILFESIFFKNTYSIQSKGIKQMYSDMNVRCKTSSKYVDNVLET